MFSVGGADLSIKKIGLFNAFFSPYMHCGVCGDPKRFQPKYKTLEWGWIHDVLTSHSEVVHFK